MESGIGAVLASLAGINVVSGPGMLDYILTQSPEKLLLDHEACGMALRLVRGIECRPGDAVKLIAELVSSGEFLSHPHTREFWRGELTVASPLIDRDSYGDWESGGAMSAADRAREQVARLLAKAEPTPLTAEVAGELHHIMKAEAARCGLESLPV